MCLKTDAKVPNRQGFALFGFVPLLLCLLTWPPDAQAGEPLHFTTAEMFSIEGRGYSPPPDTVNADELFGKWESVTLPHALLPKPLVAVLNEDKVVPLTVTTWYRLLVPKLDATSAPRYLYIPRWKVDGQLAVYGDKRLLYQSHAGMIWNGWNKPLWIPLDETAGAVAPRTILLRVQHPGVFGGGISSVWLGEEDSLAWRYGLRDALQVELPFMSSAAFLAVGMFALFVWFGRRNETLYLLFFCVSLTSYLRSIHYYVGTERLPIPEDWFSWLTVNSLFWMILTMHFFLNYLHRKPATWLNRVATGTTLVTSLITLPIFSVLPDAYTLSSLTYIILLLMGTTLGAVGLRKSIAARSTDGIMLGCWALLGMSFGVYDWLLKDNYISIESIYLGPYTNIFAFLMFTFIMFRRYVGAIDDVKRINATLEERLKERERELTEIHRELRGIEHRQMLVQERQRLMQDMHDGLGSSLNSALRVVEHGRMNADEVAEILKDCLDDLKLTIDSMEPVDADLLLLLASLRYRLDPRLESTGITLHWDIQILPELDWIDPRNALHILRILQEAFTNIIKHAHATDIRVATSIDVDHVMVTITDNGQGFDVASTAQRGGKGLRNQMRRAEMIGCEIKLASCATGTRLILRLPIRRSTHEVPISIGTGQPNR